MPLFGAAPNKGNTIYTVLRLQRQCWILLYLLKFKDFSRPLSVFHVLFKANLIFKDFSRQSCIFKYFSSLCEPWYKIVCLVHNIPVHISLAYQSLYLKYCVWFITYRFIYLWHIKVCIFWFFSSSFWCISINSIQVYVNTMINHYIYSNPI